jgi:hypothetical protein
MENSPQLINNQTLLITSVNNSQRPQHVRKRSTWMSNYEVTKIDQFDD